ncbi:MAG TPA: DUF6496 domain-containing protein [Kofleriaceae bacterium]|jgi:hypothetical protein|nr:DUF6496 domain-containing protein [Kofleriaceae bacterium]
MPEKATVRRAKQDLKRGKSPSTAAGEFVKEEIEHVREGKHGARSTKQAIAIGLSKARRAGVPLPPRGRGPGRRSKAAASRVHEVKPRSRRRSRATTRALKREPHGAASHRALSKHAKQVARKRKR